jgi:hypothetical protein
VKKKGLGLVVAVALLGGGWFLAREHFAEANADRYLSEREIPTYHSLSFHTKDDKNILGFCRPCGEKARDVIRAKVGREFDKTKQDLEHALGDK